jgi:hypothetical protein
MYNHAAPTSTALVGWASNEDAAVVVVSTVLLQGTPLRSSLARTTSCRDPISSLRTPTWSKLVHVLTFSSKKRLVTLAFDVMAMIYPLWLLMILLFWACHACHHC